MTNASAWFALVGVLGGVTVTGVMGLATAALNHRWGEQARINTHRKRAVSSGISAARHAMITYLRRMRSGRRWTS